MALDSMTAAGRGQDRRPGARSSEFRIGFLVHEVSRLRQTFFDQAMKPHGVTRAQWWALAQLSRGGRTGMAQSELARHLGLGKVAAGAMVERLEASGLVERRADPRDRRINRIQVTPHGRAILARMVAVGRRLNRTVLRGLSPEEMAVADKVLTVLRNNLRGALDGDA